MLVSVVVPCFDEGGVLDEFLDEVLAALDALDGPAELVLIDDGSRDKTIEVMRRRHAIDDRVHYLSFSRNFGKEAAIFAGLTYAHGEAIIVMDADLQHPPRLIPDMVALHRQGFDQVVARRTREGDPAIRTGLARLYYRVVNRLVDVPLEDGVGDFRLLSRRAVDALLRLRESNRFSKGLFSWVGFGLATIDYPNEKRRGSGTSKWSLRRLFNYGLDGVISFNSAPLRVALYLGFAVIALSVLYLMFLLVDWANSGVAVPGYITLIAAILGLGGVILIFLGVIGEYVGRIYYEVKQRPLFIVAESGGLGPTRPLASDE